MQKALALLLSAAMLLCLHPAAAQQPNTLTGTVTDSASGKAVGYATVSLQRDSVTVVTHPASTTHKQLSDADLAAAGVTPTMLRISVGLENTDDLIDDFEQAFAHIG